MEFWAGNVVFHWIATWANPTCDVIFRAATNLGDVSFYYLAVAPLFWAVDRRRACVLFLLILASGYINTTVKLLAHTTRPDPQLVRVLDTHFYQTGSPSFPSGHAQNAVVFWAYIAWWARRPWVWAASALCAALIAFSRLYLGVHFPIDVVGGLVLGVASLLLVTPLLERWSEAEFRLGIPAAIALVSGAIAIALVTGDLTMALISGSLVGFLAGGVWLPQSPLIFGSIRQSVVGVVGGLLTLGALALPFERIPRGPVSVFLEVGALWVVTLWCYPRLLERLRLAAAD
jgi:membrane-associated phospholipid phosphatase